VQVISGLPYEITATVASAACLGEDSGADSMLDDMDCLTDRTSSFRPSSQTKAQANRKDGLLAFFRAAAGVRALQVCGAS
jgi:hypothetical protein